MIIGDRIRSVMDQKSLQQERYRYWGTFLLQHMTNST
jgi:hypothetical protein